MIQLKRNNFLEIVLSFDVKIGSDLRLYISPGIKSHKTGAMYRIIII